MDKAVAHGPAEATSQPLVSLTSAFSRLSPEPWRATDVFDTGRSAAKTKHLLFPLRLREVNHVRAAFLLRTVSGNTCKPKRHDGTRIVTSASKNIMFFSSDFATIADTDDRDSILTAL